MNVFDEFFKLTIKTVLGFIVVIFCMIVLFMAMLFYEECLTKYHIKGNRPMIDNAYYLDNFEETGGRQKIFLVKHSMFSKTTCDEVKEWIQNNVDKNKLYNTIEVYEYDNDLKETSWLKDEYDVLLFGLDLCKFNKDEFY